MVVLGSDENVGIQRVDFRAPRFRVRFAVLTHRGGYGLIQERQFVILDVNDLELRVLAALQDIVRPLCDRGGFPSRPRAPDDDSNPQHSASFSFPTLAPINGLTDIMNA